MRILGLATPVTCIVGVPFCDIHGCRAGVREGEVLCGGAIAAGIGLAEVGHAGA
jgi:hypothetical protein